MLSLIEVKCPHCGAQGQIMLPPLGAIIVGPCPECQGMVVVFCGRVMPLDRDIMTAGTPEDKQEHLLEVLGVFLQERIKRLFASRPADTEADAEEPDTSPMPAQDDLGEYDEDSASQAPGPISLTGKPQPAIISDDEFDQFINTDLKLIDNPKYFRAVFE